MTYITENIIAMGFPAGDMSSGFFGYVEVNDLSSLNSWLLNPPHPVQFYTSFQTILTCNAGVLQKPHGRSD